MTTVSLFFFHQEMNHCFDSFASTGLFQLLSHFFLHGGASFSHFFYGRSKPSGLCLKLEAIYKWRSTSVQCYVGKRSLKISSDNLRGMEKDIMCSKVFTITYCSMPPERKPLHFLRKKWVWMRKKKQSEKDKKWSRESLTNQILLLLSSFSFFLTSSFQDKIMVSFAPTMMITHWRLKKMRKNKMGLFTGEKEKEENRVNLSQMKRDEKEREMRT